MEFKINKAVFESLLSKIYPIIPMRSTLPALANVLLETKGNKLSVSATDLETSATTIGVVEVMKEGGVAINGRDLYNIIKELPSTDIQVKVDNLLVKLQCDKGKFSMAGIDKDEFPTLSEVGKEKKVDLSCAILQRAIDKTLFASAGGGPEDDVLGGMLLELHQDGFRLVASDGHKLAIFKKKQELGKVAHLLISARVWREVMKLSTGIEIAFEKNRVGFYAEDIIIISRLIDKEFPPYESVIPKDNDKVLVVSKNELISTLKRALVFAPEVSRFIKFNISSNNIVMETSSETGEAKQELPCKYEKEEIEIAFNGNYLLSIISKIESEELQILLKDSESAILVSPTEQGEGEEIIYLLMPIRLE